MSKIKDKLGAFVKDPNDSGKLMKLRIVGFDNPEQKASADSKSTKDGANDNVFEAYYNPASFSTGYALKYANDPKVTGTTKEQRYNGYEPTTYSFDLKLDATSASVPEAGIYKGKEISVPDLVAKFKKVAYGYDGSTHRGAYLQLLWGGSTIAKCVLKSATIDFDLFKPDGTPLRAMIKCSFVEYSYEELITAGAGDKSPDMTHTRIVQEGDQLPLMCEDIYGDATLYPEVARHNKLTNFRKLTPGQELNFPPLVAK